MVDLSSLPLRCQTIGRTDRSLYPGGVHFTPEQEAQAKTCASLTLEMRRAQAVWSGEPGCSRLLRGIRVHVDRRKPMPALAAAFESRW